MGHVHTKEKNILAYGLRCYGWISHSNQNDWIELFAHFHSVVVDTQKALHKKPNCFNVTRNAYSASMVCICVYCYRKSDFPGIFAVYLIFNLNAAYSI